MSTKSSRVEAAPFAGGAPAGASGLVAEIDDRPVFSSYIDHFESAVAQWPERCAVSVGDDAFSYRRLNQLADAYAGRLRQHGCGPETIVAVSMERSIELAAALLAVMKCGAAFLPLDPEFPEERAKALVRQSGAKAMMARPRQAGIFDSCGAEVLRIQPGQMPSPSPPAGSRRVESSALAYLIYTSGSTGKPKGVAVSQEAFYSYVRWALDYYRFDPRGVALLHSSIGFDLTLTSLFCPLLCGMQIVMVPEDEGFRGVIRLLDEGNQPVSLLKLTPSHLRLMAEEVGSRRPRWDCGVLILGGEQLTAQQVKFWEERSAATRIYNEYGPTETTVGCCVTRVFSGGAAPGDPLPIGRAIEGFALRVLQPSSGSLQEREEGELFIAGPGLARGYLDAPALTAGRFLPDPRRAGQRMYASGDWVRRLDERGTLLFVGRKDRQKKISGVRVELGEIEAALAAYPGVNEAAVAGVREAGQEESLIAFLAVDDPETDDAEVSSLTDFLKDRVHQAVVPGEFFLVPRLPLALSGKVDYERLLGQRHSYQRVRDTFLPPRNPTEDLLASLWQVVLGVEEIGIDDSFFALDGNSMKSIQFIYEAKKHGLTLTTRDLFEHQTIRRLAEVVDQSGAARQPSMSARPAPFSLLDAKDREKMPAEVVDAYPLAMLQAGTIFESDQRVGSGTYHNVNSYHIECPLEVETFKRAVALVSGRHPILRTCYDYVNYSKPLQLVYGEAEIPLEVVDISHLSEQEQDDYVDNFIEKESRNAFDWTRPPLLRFFIHDRGRGRMQFTLSKHHSILDGWSAATLIAEIVKNYFALLKDQTPPFRLPLETTYREYVALEQQAIHSPDFEAFWRERLTDAPYHPIRPWGGGKPARDCAHSSITTRNVPITPELSARLKEVARRAHTPLKSVLLSAHLRMLAQVTGSTRLVTGVVSHGRPETTDADKAIGLFINTIPFHLQMEESWNWTELIGRVFEEERTVFPYQRYPMVKIKKDLGWERPFDSIFYYTNFHVFRDFRTSEELKFIDSAGFEETEIPLTVAFSLHPLTAEIYLDIHFHVDHFSSQQVQNVAEYARIALNEIAEQPQSRALACPLVTQAETTALQTSIKPLEEPPQTVFDLFEKQARRRPDALAIDCRGDQISYGALRRRSNLLAARLMEEGVGPERTVGICLERTSEAIAAMLAVNRAQGCFVVLDAQWPETRLREVLEQIDPVAVIGDRKTASRWESWPCRIVPMPDPASTAKTVPLRRPTGGGELAYIVFTSGSTGRPKGVMISNAALYRSTRTRLEFYPRRYRRFLLLSRLTFDSSFAGIWGTLCGGGTLHVLHDDRHLDVGGAAELIANRQITHFLAIPSLYRVLLPELPSADDCALDTVIVAGEELTADLLQAHRERLPGIPLVNEYGPSEAAVWSNAADVASRRLEENESGVSIGGSLDHVATLVLDRGMRPSAMGAAGELFIAGPALARGYHNAPRLTAERFLPNPHALAQEDSLLYRTGDLVRFYSDGQLQFLGRCDAQLKVRGFRIEPEEIERVFYECFPVREAMAGVREEKPGQKRIALYYVVPDQASELRRNPPSIGEVKAKLGQTLPAYTLPDDVFQVEALPRLANNKLDRSRLPSVEESRQAASQQGLRPPSSELERTLAGLWSEALSLAQVNVNQSFFEIGGDSLLANQVVLRTEKVFGVKLPLKQFYQQPTIADHALMLKRSGEEKGIDFERVASIWNRIE